MLAGVGGPGMAPRDRPGARQSGRQEPQGQEEQQHGDEAKAARGGPFPGHIRGPVEG